jgi:hypothetical protein
LWIKIAKGRVNISKDESLASLPEMTKGDATSSSGRDHIRVAAFLLFTASGIEAAISAVQSHWGLRPNTFGVVLIVGEAILAVCLLLFRRKAIKPTLTFLVGSALFPLVRNALTFDEPGLLPFVVLFSFPLILGALHVLPWVLLFFGGQSRARYISAIGVFVVGELVDLASGFMLVYATVGRHE